MPGCSATRTAGARSATCSTAASSISVAAKSCRLASCSRKSWRWSNPTRVFGCEAEVAHAREIARRGTSAHRQLAIFDAALAAGASRNQALAAVVDWLIAETAGGLDE